MKASDKYLTRPWMITVVATVCCLLWGSAFPVIKIGYDILNISSSDYKSQILFAGIRFTLAGIITVITGSIISGKMLVIKPGGAHRVIALSIFQTVLQYIFFYIALASTSGTKGSIINSVSVFFSVIIAALVFRQERLSAHKLVGCIMGFAGVVIVNITGPGLESGFRLTGEGFMIFSALSYAISSVLIKHFSRAENPVALSGYQFTLGGIIMIIAGVLLGGEIHIEAKSVLIIVYLSLVSAIAYTLWGILLKHNEVSKITVFGFMTPVFGCILSVLLLKEGLAESGLKTAIALALVSAGIYIVNKKSKDLGKANEG